MEYKDSVSPSDENFQQMNDPIFKETVLKMNAMLQDHHVNADRLITDKFAQVRREGEAKLLRMEEVELKFALLEKELAEYNNAVSEFFKKNQVNS